MAICEVDVMGPPGHIELRWDPKNADERKKAKAEFAELKACGYAFFTIPGDDKVTSFKALEGNLKAVRLPGEKKARGVAVAPMRGGRG